MSLSTVKLFLFHTPELIPTNAAAAPDCAIAIDVLRATSTIATAFSVGTEAIQAFSDMSVLMATSEQWAADKRIRAGERGGKTVEGCEFGNSPLACTPELMTGKRLFMSTTNGTRCLEKLQGAKTLLAAALINRQTVVDYLFTTQPETIWIAGSGWEGSYALEDTVCAGAIAHGLATQLGILNDAEAMLEFVGNDEMMGAIALYQQWQDNLLGLLYAASHGQRLARLNCHDDMEYCAQLDVLDVLPIQKEPGVLVKG